MKKLLLLLILSASFASAQITELTYNEEDNTLMMDQVPYELFGEPDLLWGDVVRRSYVAETRSFLRRPFIQEGRTFTVDVDMYGLQPVQYFVEYGKDGEFGIDLETFQRYGVTTLEMTKEGSTYSSEFTVPSAGVWHIWFAIRYLDGRQGGTGSDQFTVE